MPPKINCTGKTYGRLKVLSECTKIKGKKRKVLCLCCCGNKTLVYLGHLSAGRTKSCGCLRKEMLTTHGKRKTQEYEVWINMKRRCFNKNVPEYRNYGNRGITVCVEWENSFETFIRDMGPRPTSSHSIDRIDVNGNYEKSNCKWSTRQEQALNRRNNRIVSYKGEQMPLSKACEMAGINYSSALRRLDRGKDWQKVKHKS